jgi:hypothetical protein
MWKRLLAIGLALLLLGAAGSLAVPGPQRVLVPRLAGLVEVAPHIWTDDQAFGAQALALTREAERESQAFYGTLRANPRLVFCTTQACADTLGLRTRGLTYGYQLVLIGPKGLNQMITTHERLHAELHAFMGLRDVFDQRFPAWFDEGLATHLSGDMRVNRPQNPRAADWIKAAHSFRDWGRMHRDHDWRETYGAAARLVAEIEAEIGHDGLIDLIEAVGAGAHFDTKLERLRMSS